MTWGDLRYKVHPANKAPGLEQQVGARDQTLLVIVFEAMHRTEEHNSLSGLVGCLQAHPSLDSLAHAEVGEPEPLCLSRAGCQGKEVARGQLSLYL